MINIEQIEFRQHHDLREALNQCGPAAREIFRTLVPLMMQSQPCGWVDREISELAELAHTTPQSVYQCLGELRAHGIIRKASNRTFYCPIIVKMYVCSKGQ